jgi:hypothetical protein
LAHCQHIKRWFITTKHVAVAHLGGIWLERKPLHQVLYARVTLLLREMLSEGLKTYTSVCNCRCQNIDGGQHEVTGKCIQHRRLPVQVSKFHAHPKIDVRCDGEKEPSAD